MMSARLLAGRYQLHTVLGRGGMAEVWAAIDTRLDRPVAVKVLDGAALADPVMIRRFDQEARTVARLAHPNIVAVYDVGAEAGLPFLVMELVEGDTLQQRLAYGPLDVAQAAHIAAQICDGLDAAHHAGVVHRDVKPENIMLSADETVKICDFGIAHLQLGNAGPVIGVTTVVGTSQYMSPEQAAGGAADARSDLYALGCVLYAMLTGEPPFSGDNPVHVLRQHVTEPAPPAATRRTGIPADLDSLLQHLLAKNPADRPADASQVRAALAQFAFTVNPNGRPPTPPRVGPDRRPRATAAVVAPTRSMPALDNPARLVPARSRLRLGPPAVAAIAVGAALVGGLAVAILTAGHSAQTSNGLRTGPTAPVTSSPTATPSPSATTIDMVGAAIQAQVRAGQLDADAANDLAHRLDEIQRQIAKGQTRKAEEKIKDLRDRLSELRDDEKLTNAGYTAILASVDQFAAALPVGSN